VIGVSYDSDLKKAKEVLQAVLDNESRVLKYPAYTVAVQELAASSVNFVVRPWVNTSEYWPTYFSLVENIKLALDENNITIPFPHMDVHLHKD
jgi:small conductance mechanosensitive channel